MTPEELKKRVKEILALRKEGHTLRGIGKSYGISGERVRQILHQTPYKRLPPAKCLVCHEYRAIPRTEICSICTALHFTRQSGSRIEGLDRTRQIVRLRDKNTCQNPKCRRKWKPGERRLDVHHLGGICGKKSQKYDSSRDMAKLITLCHKCHMNHDTRSKKVSENGHGRIKIPYNALSVIIAMRESGLSYRKIAPRYGVSATAIQLFVKRRVVYDVHR